MNQDPLIIDRFIYTSSGGLSDTQGHTGRSRKRLSFRRHTHTQIIQNKINLQTAAKPKLSIAKQGAA